MCEMSLCEMVVRVFSDILVALFWYLPLYQNKESHWNIREDSD